MVAGTISSTVGTDSSFNGEIYEGCVLVAVLRGRAECGQARVPRKALTDHKLYSARCTCTVLVLGLRNATLHISLVDHGAWCNYGYASDGLFARSVSTTIFLSW